MRTPRSWRSSVATCAASWTCVVWPFQTSLDLLERPALRRDHDGRAEQARDGGETGMAQEPPSVSFSVGSRRHPFLLSRHADVEKAPHGYPHSNRRRGRVRLSLEQTLGGLR